MQTFSELKLQPGTLDAIAALGYETPTPIQAQAIPPFLQGRDVLAQARTGTGKTASFGIPMVDRLRSEAANPAAHGVIALVLVPTRELAIQVADEVAELAKASKLRVVTVYGGVGYGKQQDELGRGGSIVLVATPGRLIDYLQQGAIRLDRVKMLVLDEADRMLDMGFLPDVERILRALPTVRQTGFYSATVPEPIQKLSQKMLRDPVRVKVESGPATTTLTEQFVIKMEKPDKTRALLTLLHREMPERAIVFTRTKHLARRLAEQLQKHGWASVPLQGNMSQGQRERAMEGFRSGQARLLVATDVAARGIDIPELSHVINFDLPDEPEAYVHRIGRTGRMGRTGKAYTFLQSDEHSDWRQVERVAGLTVQRHDLGPLPVEAPLGPDADKAPVQFKGIQGAPGSRGGSRSPGGRASGDSGSPHGGHHAKKRPQGGGRHGSHGGHRGGPRAHGAGRASSQGGQGPARQGAPSRRW